MHFAASIPELKRTPAPALIFVFSDEQKPRPKGSDRGEDKPTKQARDSEAAWVDLFQTEGDYSVFVAGRFFEVEALGQWQH